MGQVEKARDDRKDNRRAKAKETRSRRRSSGDPANFLSCDYASILAIMGAFAEAGGAVRYGYTRDGGAYAIGVYMGDDYVTEYIRPNEDFLGAIVEIAEAWLPDEGQAFHAMYNQLRNAQEGT